MAKYKVVGHVNFFFEFDTADFPDDFARSKDDLVDSLDPNDPAVVGEFIIENCDDLIFDATEDFVILECKPISE